MSISRIEIERHFSVGDVIDSGGRRTQFRITSITDEVIRIQPTQSLTRSRLRYNKLAVVVDSFARVDENRIEASVGELLAVHDLKDTQNESYLYGFAREYIHRSRVPTLKMLEHELDLAVTKSMKSSPSDREKRLRSASLIPEKITVTTTAFRRNPDVIVEVLSRSEGKCEKCKKPAPFNRRSGGSPYLEVHHIIPLSDGGDDSVANAVALCPNCHRAAHFS